MQQKPAPQQTAAPKQDILVADMDTSVNPGDDFFAYANGGWLKRNPIPASESAWGIGNVGAWTSCTSNSARSTKTQTKRTALRHRRTEDRRFLDDGHGRSQGRATGLTPLKPELDRIERDHECTGCDRGGFCVPTPGCGCLLRFLTSRKTKSKAMSWPFICSRVDSGCPIATSTSIREAGVANIRKEYVAHVEKMLKLIGT